MSKVVKVYNSDYKISVQPGGNITLDTGTGSNIDRIISAITTTNPVTVRTTASHQWVDGQRVFFKNVDTPSDIDGKRYYIKVIDADEFELYNDINLEDSVDGTAWEAWTGGGLVEALFGNVIITGNLEVMGVQTQIDSEIVNIKDNIIVLSAGTQGQGLPGGDINYQSGIEIDRGSLNNVKWIYDETIPWQLGASSDQGTFYALRGTQKLPINTPGIQAQGSLYLDTGGSGVVTVSNTNRYEERVFNYVNNNLTPNSFGLVVLDNDALTNAKSVVDYVDFTFSNQFYSEIAQGNTSVQAIDQIHVIAAISDIGVGETTISVRGQHGFQVNDIVDISGIQANGDVIENLNGTGRTITAIVNGTTFTVDVDTTGGDITEYVADSGTVELDSFSESQVKITVEGNVISTFYTDRVNIGNIEFKDNEIYTTNNQPLILSAPGESSVIIEDVLELTPAPWSLDPNSPTPVAPADGVKIYTLSDADSSGFQDQTLGDTGIFFVNSNEARDELVSRNRAILYSMIL